jgi:isoquinoline 1-oxidoreductase alpha subunit
MIESVSSARLRKEQSMPTHFTLNGKSADHSGDPEMPLLWAIRDDFGLTGTKFGCGIAQCGACTVHVDGEAIRSCVTPVSSVSGRAVTTIEGLNTPAGRVTKQAWTDINVAQCGYCQAGQIMSASALLAAKSKPTDKDIDEAMGGNICRCATYQRIRQAIHAAAKAVRV